MKKSLFIFALCIVSCFASAQINRIIYGIELGGSVKNALTTLRAKGFHEIVNNNDRYGEYYSFEGKIIFGGETWNRITIGNYNGSVSYVVFQTRTEDCSVMIEQHSRLNEKLNTKYGKYHFDSSVKEDGSLISDQYSDGTIGINFSLSANKNYCYIDLLYIDDSSMHKREDDSINEL